MNRSAIRIGTRSSALALWQAEHVRHLLAQRRPELNYEVVTFTTSGDMILDRPLPAIGGKGLFTAELEQALLEGTVDLAVHSLKDLPTSLPDGLAVGAVTTRADSADALVTRADHRLDSLPPGARVGTSSSRRAAQLLNARPDIEVIDLRGNADTRLRKALDADGPYDGILVAFAALQRLGRADVVSEILSEDVMLPAPGQGAVGVQCRHEAGCLALLGDICHRPTDLETRAERSFLQGLGGGCAVPVAARARLADGGLLALRGRVLAPDGSRRVDIAADAPVPQSADGRRAAEELGSRLAREALARGAADLLQHATGPTGQFGP